MKRIDTAADAVAMGTEAPERQEEAQRLPAALEKAEKARLSGAACLYAERVQRTPGGNLSPGLRQSNPYHKKRLSKNGEAFFFVPFFACSPFADERENRFRRNSTDCDKEKHRAKMGRRGAAGRGAGKKSALPRVRRASGLRGQNWAASALFSCNWSLSAMRAMNSEFVGFPLVLDTV